MRDTIAIRKLEAKLEKQAKDACVKPLVSVIIPAYNVEKFISKCLDSVINQTLQKIEIIVVNDGSIDRTKEIVSVYAKYDKRIKLVNQSNQRQGAARNAGMKLAIGEYIGFVDADDWVDVDYFEKLYNACKKYNFDIALATNVRIGGKKTKKRLHITEEKEYISLQEKVDVCNMWKDGCPTNKIYRAEFLKQNNITYPEGVYCEDKIFTCKAVYYANGIVTVPDICYYYFRNQNSTVHQRHKEINENKYAARNAVLDFLIEKHAQLRNDDSWTVVERVNFLGIPIYEVKRSLESKKYYLLGAIPYKQVKNQEIL